MNASKSELNVIFLAAGLGKRMGSSVEDRPKALLPIQGKRSILDISLANLASVFPGSGSTIVAGYKRERVVEFIKDAPYPLRINMAINEKYDSTSPVKSIEEGIKQVPKLTHSLIIANGDTVFTEKVFKSLAGNIRHAGAALLVSQEPHPDSDDIAVFIDKNANISAAKKSPDQQTGTISAGMLLLSGTQMIQTFTQCVYHLLDKERQFNKQYTWHALIGEMADRQLAVKPLYVERSAWQEFDTESNILAYQARVGLC
ncbi:MAG TPA: NTP transferase domain-containing protein [Gammaproteobacteria bacterium]